MSFFPEGKYRVSALSIRILLTPESDAVLDEQALLGEEIEVIESGPEFSHVRMPYSEKTGWLHDPEQKLTLLEDERLLPSHRVSIPKAITFRKPDPTSETMVILPMNAVFAIGDIQTCGRDEFARVLGLPGNTEAWVRTSALMQLGIYEPDFVAVQERFVYTPYVWGARDSTLGFDCSRLLGESVRATGWSFCPGDVREQVVSELFGENRPFPSRGIDLRRGDLIFWKGHVATMKNQKECIHATDLKPYHRVVVQNLDDVIRERILAGKGSVVTTRRMQSYEFF